MKAKAEYLLVPLSVALLGGCVYRPVAYTPAPATVAYASPTYVAPTYVAPPYTVIAP
jgi:hypothetical protein